MLNQLYSLKKYKAVFFDWDGTAVITRTAPVDEVIPLMVNLLKKNIKLVIISGTVYENIAGGRLHELIPKEILKNLYLCLGRGAFNYGFDEVGNKTLINGKIPDMTQKLKIHDVCFHLHKYLLERYNYETDIIFSRPNYCKIDLLCDVDRKGKLFLQQGEIEILEEKLLNHGYEKGISGLIDYVLLLGKSIGIDLKATTDAKYLEVGISTKSDNVNSLLDEVVFNNDISIEQCCFWGDEFTYLGEGIQGSDAYMITDKSKGADFYNVSEEASGLPAKVMHVGGGVKSFIMFLGKQAI